MPRFVGGYFTLVFQSESDVIQAFEQAMPGEVIDLESGGEAVVIVDFAVLEVDGELVVGRSVARRAISSTSFSASTTVSTPFFTQLLAKMSANEGAITARKPKSSSAQTACSRDEPQPKFFAVARMLAPL